MFSVVSVLPSLLDGRTMAVSGSSEKPMEVCTEDIIKNVEALCVPSLFKHRCLSLPTVRTLQGQALRSKEIKNKRTSNCCVW